MPKHEKWEDAWAEQCAERDVDAKDMTKWGYAVGWLEAHVAALRSKLTACEYKRAGARSDATKALDRLEIVESFIAESDLEGALQDWIDENIEEEEPDDRHEAPMSSATVEASNRGEVIV